MDFTRATSPLFPHHDSSGATHVIYLALGSNQDDRRGNLAAAIQQLRAVIDIQNISSLYETEPVGYLDQPRFFNMALCGETRLSPEDLLVYVKAVERAVGRKPTFRNGPRVIDIDILLYDDLQVHEDQLVIPHPRMTERAFVLVPLAEIAPNVVIPTTSKRTAQALLRELPEQGVRRVAENLRIPLEHDIQSGKPTIQVRLGRAGVVGVKKALLLGEEQPRWFDVTFDLYVDLGTQQAGVHMSRFSDVLEEVLEETTTKAWPRIEVLAEQLARAIVERQKVSRAEMHIRTNYPLQKWTPVSGRRTQEVYGLQAQAVATRYGSRRMLGVEVEGMVACPCAQDMVRSYTRLRLQEEGVEEEAIEKMLEVTPLATHNQRGRATLLIGTNQRIEPATLVALVENAMSSENYALLKRPDELYIVNKAHSHPRFVEDVAREVLRGVVETYPYLDDDTFVWVHQRNEETIHKYDVDAEGWGTLGELRAELLTKKDIAHHTTKEEWLYQGTQG